MKTGNIVPAVLWFMFIAGIIGLIGIWYLAIFLLALSIFIVLLLLRSQSQKTTKEILLYRPGKEIPGTVWALAENAPSTSGPRLKELTLVELDKYAENWEAFKSVAQVERPGVVNVSAHLLCYKTPTGDYGMVLAHQRSVLGEVRRLDLETYFEPIWTRGGIVLVDCAFEFDADCGVANATLALQAFDPHDEAPPQGAWAAWKILWWGLQGKTPR